jgi:hypothetical protein
MFEARSVLVSSEKGEHRNDARLTKLSERIDEA